MSTNLIAFDGVVVATRPDGRREVRLANRHLVLVRPDGRPASAAVKPGARVVVEMLPHGPGLWRLATRPGLDQPLKTW